MLYQVFRTTQFIFSARPAQPFSRGRNQIGHIGLDIGTHDIDDLLERPVEILSCIEIYALYSPRHSLELIDQLTPIRNAFCQPGAQLAHVGGVVNDLLPVH